MGSGDLETVQTLTRRCSLYTVFRGILFEGILVFQPLNSWKLHSSGGEIKCGEEILWSEGVEGCIGPFTLNRVCDSFIRFSSHY